MSNSTKPIRNIDSMGEYDSSVEVQMKTSPSKQPSFDPSIADYIPMVYISIAIVLGVVLAVKFYKGTKNKQKPINGMVKASVSDTKPESEKSDGKD